MNICTRRVSSAALLCALGLGLVTSGGVMAAPAVLGRGPVPFSLMDANGDGAVSAQEFADHRAHRQALRAAQGRPMRNAARAPRFEAWDQDGNGLLTPQELAEGQQARLAGRRAAWGPEWGPSMTPGWGGNGVPGPGGGRPCWRNP